MEGKIVINLPKTELNLNQHMVQPYANICNSESNFDVWHRRLGHVCDSKFNELKDENMIYDSNLIKSVKPVRRICKACILRKQARLP